MAAAEATRDDIEAAYLFRFLDFVEFPADSPAGTKNFYMCVVGDDRLLSSLKSALKGKSIGSRSVVLKRIASDESAKACHVLFLDGKRRAVITKLLEIPLDPILTVTEDPQPNLAGQVIRFYFKDDHLRFDIDLENARRRGLTISSRLIQLSRSFQ